VIRFQAIVASGFGLGCLAAKIILVRRFGIVGIPWATVVTYGFLTALPCVLYIPRLIRGFEREGESDIEAWSKGTPSPSGGVAEVVGI
jgi:hypothetical protein